MPSCGLLGRVALVRTDVLVFLRRLHRLLVTVDVVPSSPILFTKIMKAISSSETSILKRGTRRNNPEDGILHNAVTYCKWIIGTSSNWIQFSCNQRERIQQQRTHVALFHAIRDVQIFLFVALSHPLLASSWRVLFVATISPVISPDKLFFLIAESSRIFTSGNHCNASWDVYPHIELIIKEIINKTSL
jgi:hypothetical protein